MPRASLFAGSLRISQADADKITAGQMPQQLFFEIVLARVEVNRNRDEFTPEHLRELAASISHTPLDDNHRFQIVQGTIIDAWYDETEQALIAACVTWPERFPEVARDLLNGSMRFSVENVADFVECSTCQSRFPTTTAESDYCACLRSRFLTKQTSRRWINNRGIGGGFTKDPAGSECTTRDGSLLLVAAYASDVSPLLTSGLLCASRLEGAESAAPTTIHVRREATMTPEKFSAFVAKILAAAKGGKALDDNDGDEGDDEQAKANKKTVKAAFADFAAHAAEQVTAAVSTAKTDVTTALTASHQQEIDAVKAEGQKALVTERRMAALAGVQSFEKPEEKRELIASMSEEVWQIALAGYRLADSAAATAPSSSPPAGQTDPPAPPSGGSVLAGSVQGQTGVPTPTEPTATPGGGNAPPKSLAEFSWN